MTSFNWQAGLLVLWACGVVFMLAAVWVRRGELRHIEWPEVVALIVGVLLGPVSVFCLAWREVKRDD